MIPRKLLGALAFAVLATLAFSAAVAGGACSDSVPSDQGQGGTTTTTTTMPATTGSTSGTGGGPDCTMNPTTYLEIINACTNAQAIDVNPVLPLLTADGGLPPLP